MLNSTRKKFNDYAQTLILVNLILVNFLGFLVIARYPTMRFGRKLEEMHPTGLPELSKPKNSGSNRRKTSKNDIQNSKKIRKI